MIPEMGTLLAAGDPLNHVVQHSIIDGPAWWGPILSNQILMLFATAAVVLWIIPKAVQNRAGTDEIGRLVPRGSGNALEAMCVGLREMIFRPNLGKYTDFFTPFLWSAFFFVWTANLLGLIPLMDWTYFIKGGKIFGGTATANIYVTGTLALIVLGMQVYWGLKFHGMHYVKHFFMGPFPINILIAVLEIFGLLAKTMALAIRLFANMIAGHVLLAVLLGFVGSAINGLGWGWGSGVAIATMIAQVAIYFLELLVAFLQAFIFTTLSTVFIGLAVNIHHDHEHDHEHADLDGPDEAREFVEDMTVAAHAK